jgi:hypothetical protein
MGLSGIGEVVREVDPEQQSLGLFLRRQAHEALIHRLDAELTMGERTPMDADINADGVDEALDS